MFFLIEDIHAIENSPISHNPVLRDHNLPVEEYVIGLQLPTTIAFIDNDLLVLEKNGNVRLIRDGILQSAPVLSLEVSKTLEDGLIGILAKDNLVTSSKSATQKGYYYDMQYSSEDQFSVTYGHIAGSGSGGGNGCGNTRLGKGKGA